MFGNKVGHLGRVGSLTLAQRVSAMFSRGEPGAWYDPSDLSTLFQDAAGTTPVTAVEQPVGRMLDKSGRGNHAVQATTTKRPVLSARVNVLEQSELMIGGVWSADSATLSLISTGLPDGVSAATKITPTATNSKTHRVRQLIPASVPQGAAVVRVTLKSAGYTWAKFRAGSSFCNINLSTGAIGNTLNLLESPKINQLGDGWVAVEITPASLIGGFYAYVYACAADTNSLDDVDSEGDGVSAVLATAYDIRLKSDARLPYQWVNTATDYDADPNKFPAYRRLDGVDDSHASATSGGGTSGFFFSAAVSPQGGAGTARTLFSDAGTNTGYIVRINASNQLELAAGNGTTYTTIATAGTLAVGTTDIVQAWDDGTNLNVKIGNGAAASIARPVVSAGTAGYTMGQDNGASTGYFNGRAYSTIYRKDSGLTQVQRESVALYQRQKARMP